MGALSAHAGTVDVAGAVGYCPQLPQLYPRLTCREHLELFAAIGRVHAQVLGRTLPLNGAGVCGAALGDLGLPTDMLRGPALLARTAGLLGQLSEEHRRPLAMDMYLGIDRNATYVAPDAGKPADK